MDTKKVIIFGAGDGGIRIKYLLEHQYKVIAYADNDPKKEGSLFFSIPVISPTKIKTMPYDLIIISTIHGSIIYKQLTEELDVDKSKIINYYEESMFDTRIAAIRQIADEIYSNNITGEVAELGVYQGEFARYISESFPDRKFYLFDTFNGFEESDILIEEKNKFSEAKIGDFFNNDIEMVLKKIKNNSNCIIKKGYFPDSSIGVEDVFSFVSIDVDLYKPIIEGLKFFYPRLSKGGYIIIHDYNSSKFLGVKKAVKEYCHNVGASYVPLSDLYGSVIITK